MGYLPFDLTLSTTLSNSQAQANDAALDTAISGNLTQANMSADTRFPNAMLASPNVEELIVLQYLWGTSITGTGAAITTGNKAVVGVHGTASYAIQGARYDFTCTGGTAAAGNTFQVLAGNYNGTGFTTSSTIINSTSFYTAAGNVANSQNATLTTTSFTAPMSLLLTINAVSGTPPTGGLLTVTLRVTRSLQ